ncbi:hypothetical protein M1307_02955 [Patescibacteria group bacterium]|nr:hypothetical protein [Patescibacteria group bacterium]
MRGIKSKKENKWKRIAVFIALILVFGFLLNSVRKIYNKKEEAQKVMARMEEEKAKLKEREKFLNDSLARLETTEGLKFEMRKKLNVAEVGESVAIIVNEEQTSSASNSEISPWQKLKDFLVGLFKNFSECENRTRV